MGDEVSIGTLFEELDRIRSIARQASKKTTGFYERDIANCVYDLGQVMADVLYLLREHLGCHDCVVVNHTHQLVGLPQPETAEVGQVFAHDMKGGEEGGTSGNDA